MSVAEHKAYAPSRPEIRVAIFTVSDSRTPENDEGGNLVELRARMAELTVTLRDILPDDAAKIAERVAAVVESNVADVVLLTGGTGVSPRDQTPEALLPLFDRRLDGFGELFRALSFAEIGAAAMLSRAVAGTIGRVIVFAMPGSPPGVALALDRLILPELAHLVGQLHRPASAGGGGSGGGGLPAGHHDPGKVHHHPHVHGNDHSHGHDRSRRS